MHFLSYLFPDLTIEMRIAFVVVRSLNRGGRNFVQKGFIEQDNVRPRLRERYMYSRRFIPQAIVERSRKDPLEVPSGLLCYR